MVENQDFESLGDLFQKKKTGKKPPTYQWQELALRVIKDLRIPNQKKSSVFKVCKENSKEFVEKCLNDTKELCEEGEEWRYFFKLVNDKENSKN